MSIAMPHPGFMDASRDRRPTVLRPTDAESRAYADEFSQWVDRIQRAHTAKDLTQTYPHDVPPPHPHS